MRLTSSTAAVFAALSLSLAAGCGGGATVQAEAKAPPPSTATPEPTPPAAEAPKDVGAVHLKGDHLEIDQQILFDTDSDHIDEEKSKTLLTDLVTMLKAHPELVHLSIEGHTDARGSAAHNKDLSDRRAAAVGTWLAGHGLPNVKFEHKGHGSEKPLCTEATDACHDKNRRVEFIVLPK